MRLNAPSTLAICAALVLSAAPSSALDVLCIYYPEWHVYPEGEAIFGNGRTEWDYVDSAIPRFEGHEQPLRLLAGHPDDSDPSDVAKEIDLAADAGINAFVYDWYWADGHPIQHEALERGFLRAPNRKRIRFALMWANHNRADVFRTAPGKCNDRFWWRLKYDREECLAAIDYCIAHYVAQPEYYRKDGKLFFSIYSAHELVKGLGGADATRNVFAEAQERMAKAGLPPLHFSAMVRDAGTAARMAAAGFESASAYNITPYEFDDSKVVEETGERRQLFTHEEFADLHATFNAKVAAGSPVPFIPVVSRGWDTSPRCRLDEPFPWRTLWYPYLGIIRDLSPDAFARSVDIVRRQAEVDPKKPGAILINAWNEYTEGCYLMPDAKNGDAYLRALRRALAAKVAFPPKECLSGLWEVLVDGRPNAVTSARTGDPPFDKRDFGGEYAFTSFEATAPTKVVVRPRTAREMSRVRILPASVPVETRQLPDGALELVVARPCKFSVEPDGKGNPLLVFADPPERNVPNENDPKVKVYGPGVHLGGDKGLIELKDGETLYLKAGAFVKGCVIAHGNNIRICGRGVLDCSDWKWKQGPSRHVLLLSKCRNATVEDITIRGAYHWTMPIEQCDGVTVRNVKICGSRVLNDDGIDPCNSRNVLIEDCFIRTQDDCIAAKGLDVNNGNCENVTVRNCVFWCDWARIVLLGHESRAPYMRNFSFTNCDVLHFRLPVFLMEHGEEMRIEHIRVKDFRINTDVPDGKYAIVSARPAVNHYMQAKSPGHISDCSFENVSVTGERADCVFEIAGRDAAHKARNVGIANASLYGTPVKAGDPSVKLGAFAENVTVKP